jgi:hypothetical protein
MSHLSDLIKTELDRYENEQLAKQKEQLKIKHNKVANVFNTYINSGEFEIRLINAIRAGISIIEIEESDICYCANCEGFIIENWDELDWEVGVDCVRKQLEDSVKEIYYDYDWVDEYGKEEHKVCKIVIKIK